VDLEAVDFIDLAQNRNRWQAVLNTVIQLWVPEYVGNFLTR